MYITHSCIVRYQRGRPAALQGNSRSQISPRHGRDKRDLCSYIPMCILVKLKVSLFSACQGTSSRDHHYSRQLEVSLRLEEDLALFPHSQSQQVSQHHVALHSLLSGQFTSFSHPSDSLMELPHVAETALPLNMLLSCEDDQPKIPFLLSQGNVSQESVILNCKMPNQLISSATFLGQLLTA